MKTKTKPLFCWTLMKDELGLNIAFRAGFFLVVCLILFVRTYYVLTFYKHI